MQTLTDINLLLTNNNISISADEYVENTHNKFNVIYTACPECSNTKKKKQSNSLEVILDQNIFICQHCGFTGNINKNIKSQQYVIPKMQLSPLPEKIQTWFNNIGISKETLTKYGVGYTKAYMPKNEDHSFVIAYPYMRNDQLINMKFEDSKGHHKMLNRSEITFYGIDEISSSELIIVESELDKLCLYEAGYTSVVALPIKSANLIEDNYFVDFDFINSIEQQLLTIKKVILLFSNNETSQKVQEELARRISKDKCHFLSNKMELDSVHKYLQKFGKAELISLVGKARPYPIKGIFEMVDVEDKFDALYENGLTPGSSTGWDNVNELYTVKEGQWTLVTGVPGHGKSNFLDGMLVNLADKQHWKIGIFSPENQPIERHLANLLEKYTGMPFNHGIHERLSEEDKEKGKKWLQDRFYIILPDEEEDNWSLDGILRLAKSLVFRKGIKGLVIDPWNEIDHSRPGNLSETEYISQSLTKIRRFARTYNVHVWVVAHPAKMSKDVNGRYPVPTPYDVSGSAHWRNKADNAVSVWRNVGGVDDDIADIYIQKIRFKEIGKVGFTSLRYDKVCGRYLNDIDQNKRIAAKEKNLDIPSSEILIKRR